VWIVGFFVLMAMILFLNIKYPEIKLNDVFVLILGVALGAVKDVNQFFFGSSAGSAAKDATIREITATANPPPVVVTPVKAGKRQ
jgi:hypothetical protein